MKKLSLVVLLVLAIVGASLQLAQHAAGTTRVEHVFTAMDSQNGAPWGLDRIDGATDGSYTYISSGSGVRIYVIDTGIDASHPDFGSRVLDGFDAFGENLDQTDCHGHGTHVAGIAAGSYFGVAKSATLVPVRVLNCAGQGTTTTLTAGIDWILANHPAGVPAIVNMSLGGPKDDLVNAATSRLVSAGMLVTVAAGNSGADACTFSPASATGVIAVGSISIGDTRSTFSNWGSCVDIFAPGAKISSDSPFNHATSVQKSGTSQASSFVAGILATYLSSGMTSVEQRLYSLAEPNSVVGGNSARNSIANVEKPVLVVPPTVDVPVVSPTPTVPPAPTNQPNNPNPVPTGSATPAPTPTPTPTPTATPIGKTPNENIPVVQGVKVFQVASGSYDGLLVWEIIDGASEYRVYKKSSARPNWRLFWVETGGWNYQTIVDAPGTIAIYQVVAISGSQTIDLGTFTYKPTK